MTNIERVLTYAVPLIAIAVSYVFGRLESNKSAKRAVALERYQQFYVPFIKHFYDFYMETVPYEIWIIDIAESLNSLIMQNLEYLDKESIALVPKFNRVSRLLWNTKQDDGNKDISEFIQVFNDLTNCVLSESIKLAKLLYLPPLGQGALEVFSQLRHDNPQGSNQEEH